jgi:hypothetical protein
MATLARPSEAPPDGWFYICSTGKRIDGWDLTELTELVAAHYEWKGVNYGSKPELRLEIQRQICSGLPKGHCQPEPGENYAPFEDQARNFDREMILSASKATLEWLKTGILEEKTESERRAAVCRTCRFNRPSPSWVCSALCATLDALVPVGRRENGLSICGICACSLPAKVIAPKVVVDASNAGRDLRFPHWCWQGEDSTNPAKAATDSPHGP